MTACAATYYADVRAHLDRLKAVALRRPLNPAGYAAIRSMTAELAERDRAHAAYDRAHAEAMLDPTGQDLDEFYGDDE